MSDGPSKTDLQTAMRKLRSLPANKVCFDCGAKNPTWASVTYGVFLCIDCSATHRNLGVHLTFIRSTNLDTNWNWLQLRSMQLGGNANATQFFKQHGCNTTDAQQKYKSRAAQLYRDKLAGICQEAQRKYGAQLIIDTMTHHESQDQEDVDFFAQEFNTVHVSNSNASLGSDAYICKGKEEVPADESAGPRVDHIDSVAHETAPPPSVILKKPVKKPAAAAKKGGLGAQKVKVNFSELEQRAAEMEKEAEATNAPINLNMEEPKADQTPAAAQLSARLAMQDLEKQRKNIEAKVAGDATKAAAAERLGMGGIARGRVAHSVALGARTIAQADASGRESRRQPEEKKDDEWEVVDTVKWGSSSKNSSSNNGFDDDLWNTSSNPSSKNDFDFEKPAPKPYASTITEKPARSSRQAGGPTHAAAPEVDVQKKFANAKAISSDMYFGSNEMDYETKAALSRFEGQSSLGSADLWGNGQQQQSSSYASQVPEMSDIKDSLRAGASKVAEKFSSLSSSLSSYMSVVRFGERMAAHRNQAAKMRLMLMRDEANGIPVFDRHQLEIPQSLWNQVDNLHDAALIAFRQWHMKRMELLDKMAEVEADLRSLEKGCNVSMVVGSSFGVAGGVAIVAGLAMPPVAVGDNVSISGLIVSGAAAASNFVTSMVKIGVTKKKLRQIEEMLHQDSYNFGSLNEAVVELGKYLELLKDRYPELDNPDVEISSSVFSLLQMGSTGITAAVRSVLLKESAAVSTAFARGAVRSLAVVGVVLDGISIALSSRDLAKGSPSALADKLSMARNELEQHLFENCEAVSMQLGIENPYPQPINDKANDNDIDVGIDIAKDRDNDIAND